MRKTGEQIPCTCVCHEQNTLEWQGQYYSTVYNVTMGQYCVSDNACKLTRYDGMSTVVSSTKRSLEARLYVATEDSLRLGPLA